MTLDECQEYLPDGWTELIWQDPVLREIFEEHDYDLELEAVPPFLFQALRGGELDRLRPVFARYGPPGLEMLRMLREIDDASRDTAQVETPSGTAYAGYFFANFPGNAGKNGNRGFLDGLFARTKAERLAREAAERYIRAIHQVFTHLVHGPAPIDPNPRIELLSGEEGYKLQEQLHKDFVARRYHPGTDIYGVMGHLTDELVFQGNCRELADTLGEALYHINNDYVLSACLCWPLLDRPPMENPLQGYFDLWKMGLEIEFPERDRVVLVS